MMGQKAQLRLVDTSALVNVLLADILEKNHLCEELFSVHRKAGKRRRDMAGWLE